MLEQGVGGPRVGAQGPSLCISLHRCTGEGQEREGGGWEGRPHLLKRQSQEDRLSPCVMVGPQTSDLASPREGAGVPDRRFRKAGPGRWAGRPEGQGTGGSEAPGPWADTGLQAMGGTVVKPPGLNGASTPGHRGSEGCRPQREGNRVSGVVAMLTAQRAPSVAPQSNTPSPGRLCGPDPLEAHVLCSPWASAGSDSARRKPGLALNAFLGQGCGS